MSAIEVTNLVISSGALIFVIKLVYSTGKIIESFKNLNVKVDAIILDLKELHKDSGNKLEALGLGIATLEGRFLERDYVSRETEATEMAAMRAVLLDPRKQDFQTKRENYKMAGKK